MLTALLFTLPALAQDKLVPRETTSAPVVTSVRRSVPLKEALLLTAKNNPDLRSAQAQAAQVAAQASRVWSAILPELTVGGSLVHTSAPAALDLGQFVGLVGGVYQLAPQNTSLIPAPLNIVAPDSAYGNVLISQILFTPQIVLIPAASDGTEAARLGGLEAREQILLGAAKVYLGIQGLLEIEKATRDAEVVALRREKDARAQLGAGMADEVAVLRAQADTARTRNSLAQLGGQKEALLSLLESMAGEAIRPLDEKASASASVELGEPADEATTPWEKNYGIRSAQLQVETQRAFHTYDRLAWLPTVLAQARGNYNSNAGFSGQRLSYDLILAANFPLYDRGVRYSTMHENDAKLVDALAKVDAGRARAKATWVAARANLVAARAALDESIAQAQLATRAQKQLEGAARAGVATSLELSDIDSKRFFAESAAAQARSQLEIRKVELAAAEGRLARAVGLE